MKYKNLTLTYDPTKKFLKIAVDGSDEDPLGFRGQEIDFVKTLLTEPTADRKLGTDEAWELMNSAQERCEDDCYDDCRRCGTLRTKHFIASNRQGIGNDWEEMHFFPESIGGITICGAGKSFKFDTGGGTCGVDEFTINGWQEAKELKEAIERAEKGE